MTGDPLRLLDDPTIGATLRTDLGAASGGAAYDVEAGLARFESTLASNMARGTGAVGGGMSGGFAVGALVLAGGLAAALGWQLAGPAPAVATTYTVAARAAPPTIEPLEPGAAPVVGAPGDDEMDAVDVVEVVEASEPAVLEDHPVIRPARVARIRGQRGVRSETSAVRGSGDALREARELNAARSLLGKQPARALALAEAGAAEFRGGTFTPEWEGVAVLALFELRRVDEARTRGEAFLQRHPSGTYAPRIRQAIDAGRP